MKTRMFVNNLKTVAQGTQHEREHERETVDVNRWEDDGGQAAPAYSALTTSHHQAPSGRAQRPQELDALARLTEHSRPALDAPAGDRSAPAYEAKRQTGLQRAQE